MSILYKDPTGMTTPISTGGGNVDIATSNTVGIVKPDNLTMFVDSNGTLHTDVWIGTLAKYLEIRDSLPNDISIIITDSSEIPSDPYIVNGVKIVSWATGTDAEISDMIAGHDAGKINIYDYWTVGDRRAVQLSAMQTSNAFPDGVEAQTVYHVLADTSYDTNNDIHFVVVQEDPIVAKGRLNVTTASSSNKYRWSTCDMRTALNSDYYNALPSTYKTLFKTINVRTNDAWSGTDLETTQDKFAIPSEREIFDLSAASEYSYYGHLPETTALTQMQYYAESQKGVNESAKALNYTSANIPDSYEINYNHTRTPGVWASDNVAATSKDGTHCMFGASASGGIHPFGCI